MKRNLISKDRIGRFYLLILAAAFFISPHYVYAHGTESMVSEDIETVTVEFYYSDNQPMSYAEILVFSPENDKIEFQNGRTDKNGRFSFSPDVPGKWRVEVNDGMGHKHMAEIYTDSNVSMVHTETHHHSHRGTGIIAGLSLILNFVLVFYLIKKRKN